MSYSFKDGAIIVNERYYKEVKYDVSNNAISVCFDGKGAITSYSEANEKNYITNGFCAIHENNKHINIFKNKKVTMLGRAQQIEIELDKAKLNIEQILDETTNGILIKYSLDEIENINISVDISLMFNNITNAFIYSTDKIKKIQENSSVAISLDYEKQSTSIFISFKEIKDAHFYKVEENYIKELNSIKLPLGLTDLEKAVYYSAYYCALENYKEKDEYKAFMAGCNYILPMRSYYRDSYWTTLPMYNGCLDKIRNQILTLAKGILENGDCPSAVKFDYNPWWIGHYDSPSFFIMMIYDYINYTGDNELLQETINGETILEKAIKVINKLSTKEGKLGLLYKDGNYNKCDWTDEVNRNGYVTYNNILYARACQCMMNLCKIVDNGTGERVNYYLQKYYKLVKAINNELWSNEKGYYINYKYQKSDGTWFIEDNLSIDTVLAVLYSITDKEQSESILKKMENILECKNNKETKENELDFGVMCLYPPYSNIESAYNKSSQPFNYHNGANWPYLTALYAMAKRKYSMEYKNILTDWFVHNIEKGNYTPVEYYSSTCKDGSLLQAWCGTVAFVLDTELSNKFWE